MIVNEIFDLSTSLLSLNFRNAKSTKLLLLGLSQLEFIYHDDFFFFFFFEKDIMMNFIGLK